MPPILFKDMNFLHKKPVSVQRKGQNHKKST